VVNGSPQESPARRQNQKAFRFTNRNAVEAALSSLARFSAAGRGRQKLHRVRTVEFAQL